jgi:hypothetical protein
MRCNRSPRRRLVDLKEAQRMLIKMKTRRASTSLSLRLPFYFVSASEDPVTGNNQKGKDFWQTVTDKFNQLLTEEDVDDQYQRDRKMIITGRSNSQVCSYQI